MSAAREIEEMAALWLVRREEPGWSSENEAALDSWLEESMAHKAAYWRLQHGWREADRIRSLGLPARRGLDTPVRYFGRSWKPLAMAASLLAVIGVGATQLTSWQARPVVSQAQYRTEVGGHRRITLPDGSKAELNTATIMRTAVGQDRREVWLEQGEAYFDVAHVEGQPFVVHAGERTVTVLGTRFSVRRDGRKVTVNVAEGRVRVADAGAPAAARSAIIAAGDVAIARGPSTLVVARSQEKVESALAWRDGILAFDQVTLAEAAAEFNRYNERPIIISDPRAAGIRIGGTFEASNVDAFARLLRDAYGMRVTQGPEAVKISS